MQHALQNLIFYFIFFTLCLFSFHLLFFLRNGEGLLFLFNLYILQFCHKFCVSFSSPIFFPQSTLSVHIFLQKDANCRYTSYMFVGRYSFFSYSFRRFDSQYTRVRLTVVIVKFFFFHLFRYFLFVTLFQLLMFITKRRILHMPFFALSVVCEIFF